MDALGKNFSAPADAENGRQAPAAQEGGSGRPSRDSLFLSARLSVHGGDAREVRVRNLSERGLMVEIADPLPVGAAVSLELRGVGAVDGRVAWYAEGRAGVALDREIDPASARRRVGTRAR